MRICIDTNVFISVMNKESNSSFCELIFDAIEKRQIEAILSTIVIAEVLVGFNQNEDEKGKQKFLEKIKLFYKIVPVSLELAENAAELRAAKKIKLPDAIIYATAIEAKVDGLISNDHPLVKKGKMQILTPKEFNEQYYPFHDQSENQTGNMKEND